MRCVGNYAKDKKDTILKASEISGAAIEWRDEPNERMKTTDPDYASYGSIWSDDNDLSEFWRVYNDLQEKR